MCCVGSVQIQIEIEIEKGWCTAEMDSKVQRFVRRSFVDLSLFSLTNVDLSLFSLKNVDLSLLSLTNVDLSLFSLKNVDLSLFSLTNVDLSLFSLTNVDLSLFSLTKGPAAASVHQPFYISMCTVIFAMLNDHCLVIRHKYIG